MTRQEIFDTVVKGLFAQGRPSMRPNSNKEATLPYVCAYRGVDNTKCAVGFLIPDDDYRPYMDLETCTAGELCERDLLAPELRPHIDLLQSLQHIHDTKVVRIADADGKPISFDYPVLLECLHEVVVDYELDRTILNQEYARVNQS